RWPRDWSSDVCSSDLNWARYGDDSASALSDGQFTGLVSQIGPGGVSHAVMALGSNDFAPTGSVYFNIYLGLWSTSQITIYANARIANIEGEVQTLQNAGVPFIIGNYLDFGATPAVRGVFGNASNRNRVTGA